MQDSGVLLQYLFKYPVSEVFDNDNGGDYTMKMLGQIESID